MFKFDETMFGKQVRFINAQAHEKAPNFYPEVGTVGIIVPVSDYPYFNSAFSDEKYLVKWPRGSTSWIDLWACGEESLELVED